MEINLDEFKAPGRTNTRVSTGQTFTGIKFKDKTFTFSNAIFSKLGLATSSLLVRIHPVTKQVVLVPAEDSEGDIFNRTPKTGVDKGKSIVSSVIEKALKETGLLTDVAEKQYVDIQDATAGGKVVYVIVAGGGLIKGSAPSVPASQPELASVEASNPNVAEGAFPEADGIELDTDPEAPVDEFEDNF